MTVGRNKAMFNNIRSKLNEANQELGKERGEAPDVQSIIEFEGDDGNVIKIKSSELVEVIRNNKKITIRAFEVEEGDDLKL
jgi:hypothetical protein